ncbi:Carboxylesterase type B [Labilithrix luteola]|uniref:Carboxylic ester hydrolase n=1 Tax=Labilithrix luteola TaxID=1391654 RepID=A0A0K1Q419_9BACT|nr:Carboxylesterase type B [Labilithrix luteola]
MQDEDCLHVTVWTPSCSPPRSGPARPVLFWIHGGGFEAGSASNPLADGARLSARGDVVVVSVTYRLGALGFLQLEDVPSNRGLLDQIGALEWVRENVRAFGGDPDNVTIFGSSAGATCVTALLATQGRSGLFRRAIVQSGTAEGILTDELANATRRELLVQLGTSARETADVREVLEGLPVDRLLAAQSAASAYLQDQGVVVPIFQLVLDETSLPRLPLAAIHAGSAKGVDLFVGTNKDELRLWSLAEDPPAITDHDHLVRFVAKFLAGPFADDAMRRKIDVVAGDIAARYVALRPRGSFTDLFFELATDLHFRLPALRLLAAQSRHAQVFSYLLSWDLPILRGALGSPHAMDIPFLFGTYDSMRMMLFLGAGPDRALLSNRMQDAWTSFARRGDPSFDGFDWPRFDVLDQATGVLGNELRVLRPAFRAETDAWSPVWRELYEVEGVDTDDRTIEPEVPSVRHVSIPPPQLRIESYPAPT